MCRIVTGSTDAGNSGKCFLIGSSRESLPSRASNRTAAAVNCLDTEPASKIVSGWMTASCSRSAMPYPFASTSSPLMATPTVHPGVAVESHREKTASTFMAGVGAGCCWACG